MRRIISTIVLAGSGLFAVGSPVNAAATADPPCQVYVQGVLQELPPCLPPAEDWTDAAWVQLYYQGWLAYTELADTHATVRADEAEQRNAILEGHIVLLRDRNATLRHRMHHLRHRVRHQRAEIRRLRAELAASTTS